MIMSRHSDKLYKVQIDFVYHESDSTVYLGSAWGIRSRGYEYGRPIHDDVESFSHLAASAGNNWVEHLSENYGIDIPRDSVRATPKLLFEYQSRSSLTEQEKGLHEEVKLVWNNVVKRWAEEKGLVTRS